MLAYCGISHIGTCDRSSRRVVKYFITFVATRIGFKVGTIHREDGKET